MVLNERIINAKYVLRVNIQRIKHAEIVTKEQVNRCGEQLSQDNAHLAQRAFIQIKLDKNSALNANLDIFVL